MGAYAGDGCINLDEFFASPHSLSNATAGARKLTLPHAYIYTHIHRNLDLYTDMYMSIYIYTYLIIYKNVCTHMVNWPKVRITYSIIHVYTCRYTHMY